MKNEKTEKAFCVQTPSVRRPKAALVPPACDFSFYATRLFTDKNLGHKEGRAHAARQWEPGAPLPTICCLLPSPFSPSVSATTSCPRRERRQTCCCQNRFSQTQARLRSRSVTPTPGSEGPSHHTVTLGRGWVQELRAGEEQLSPGTVTLGLALPLTYCMTPGSQNNPTGPPCAVIM